MAFTLKGAFSKVASAMEAAWSEVKTGAVDCENFITTMGPTVTKDTAEIGAVISAAVPSASGAITLIEALESKVMGIILTGATELANATGGTAVQTVTALKALTPQIEAAAALVSKKQVVTAVNS